jgi:hypothetical protein
LPLLGVSLDRVQLLVHSLEGFLRLAHSLTELPQFLALDCRMRRFYLTDGLLPFRQLGLHRGQLLLGLLVAEA